jgi:hypothetical protein
VITVPAQLPIELTVASQDARAHRILLRTPQPVSLSVPAHGSAAARLKGPPPGRYALDIDGAPKGALVIGDSPGP